MTDILSARVRLPVCKPPLKQQPRSDAKLFWTVFQRRSAKDRLQYFAREDELMAAKFKEELTWAAARKSVLARQLHPDIDEFASDEPGSALAALNPRERGNAVIYSDKFGADCIGDLGQNPLKMALRLAASIMFNSLCCC